MSSAAILVFLFITFTFTYVLFKFFLQPKPKKNRPPGPSTLPIIGNLHHILCALPHRKLYTLSQKYGPIMSLQLGQVPTVIISSSKAAESFLKTHDLVFASRPKIQASEIFSYGSRGLAFSAYGPYWRSVRKLCTLKLLSASKVEMFGPVRKEELGVLVESLKKAALVGEVVNVSEVLENVVENIVYKMVLGRCHYEQFNVKSLIQQGMALLGAFNLADFVPWLGVFDLQGLTRTCKKISKAMDEVLEMIITEHEQNPIVDQNTNEDFVDILLATIHEDIDHEDEENRVSDRTYIKAILLDMIVAASDTSATSSQWALSELLRHPRVMKKLQNEIQNVVGNDRMVEEKDVKKFTYLDMVIDEMLRVHPVAPLLVPRESRESITIDGYFIEKNTRVMVNAWSISRDPTNWSNPEDFVPERFTDKKLNYQGQEFESIPFGSGRRGCAGMNMGLTTIKLIISQLVHCFDWELPNNVTPSNLNMEEKFGLTVTRAKPLFAIPHYRLGDAKHEQA